MSENIRNQIWLRDCALSKKLVKYFFIVFGAFVVAGIGYFSPSLRYQVPSVAQQNKFIHQIVEKSLPKENTLLQSQYDSYLEKKIQAVFVPFLGEESVKAVVRAELEIQKKKTIEEKVTPPVSVDEVNENYSLPDQTSRKIVTQVTKYHVKKLNAFVFFAETTDKQRNQFFQLKKNNLLKNVQMMIGYNPQRGDTFQVVDFPSALSFAPIAFQKIQYRQIIAVALITVAGLVMLVYACWLWLMRHYRKKMNFSLVRPKETNNMFRHQIIGDLEENLISRVQTVCVQMPEIAVNALRCRLYDHSSFKSNHDSLFSPAQQAAIILLCLGDQCVQLMFKQMSDAEIKTFLHIIAGLGSVKAIDIHPILMRFYRQMLHPQDIIPPQEQTKALLRANLTKERAQALIKELNKPVFGKSLWEKLNKVPDSKISAFLSHEYPQTSAELLYRLSTEKATRVLKPLSFRLAAEILLRISAFNNEDFQSPVFSFFSIDEKLKPVSSGEIKAAAILSLTEVIRRKKLLSYMVQTAPQTAEILSKRLITFDDFSFWSETDLKTLLKHIDEETLVAALSQAGDNVKEAFVRVIEPKKWVEILQKTTAFGIENIQKTEEAQAKIIQRAQLLIDTRKCKGKML